MLFRNGLFTSESVSGGHPDKVCDQISDAILDAFLRLDPHARVACESFAADRKILVAGEFRTRDEQHFRQVRDSAADIVRKTLRDIGYGTADYDIDPASCEVEVRFNHQSPQIAQSVDRSDAILGAGDQGLMFGYATDETESLMPLSWSLATELLVAGWSLRDAAGFPLKPDAKSQVTVSYEEGRPVGVDAVVLSWQHQPGISIDDVRGFLQSEILDRVIPPHRRTRNFRAFLNPAGAWTIGGPKGDTGLTGRKIIVDSYGGACPHGGGAYSERIPRRSIAPALTPRAMSPNTSWPPASPAAARSSFGGPWVAPGGGGGGGVGGGGVGGVLVFNSGRGGVGVDLLRCVLPRQGGGRLFRGGGCPKVYSGGGPRRVAQFGGALGAGPRPGRARVWAAPLRN